jgi:hypothetical protein
MIAYQSKIQQKKKKVKGSRSEAPKKQVRQQNLHNPHSNQLSPSLSSSSPSEQNSS